MNRYKIFATYNMDGLIKPCTCIIDAFDKESAKRQGRLYIEKCIAGFECRVSIKLCKKIKNKLHKHLDF